MSGQVDLALEPRITAQNAVVVKYHLAQLVK